MKEISNCKICHSNSLYLIWKCDVSYVYFLGVNKGELKDFYSCSPYEIWFFSDYLEGRMLHGKQFSGKHHTRTLIKLVCSTLCKDNHHKLYYMTTMVVQHQGCYNIEIHRQAPMVIIVACNNYQKLHLIMQHIMVSTII